ncbi:MAG: anti-sigma regulatory factor [Acidimicrobiia bacterium]|nr:MAG: anti-sigma regulatory factor [Acidimicrobiia bacterium]
MTILDARHGGTFEHDAFVYGSDAAYVEGLVPMIDDAIASGAPVYAVVPPRNAALLRSALHTAADRVVFADAGDWYSWPAAAIARYDDVLRGLGSEAIPLVVGEVDFGTTRRDLAEWTRYEAAINDVLAHHAVHVVCPYDERRLPGTVIDDVRRTHPHVRASGERRVSEQYVPPERLLRSFDVGVELPVSEAAIDLDGVVALGAARRAFARIATATGIAPERVADLTVAVNEVLTNAMLHGGGAARLRVWAHGPGGITCVVDDDGPGSDDRLLGLRPPRPGGVGGYGLWLARRLFERSEITRAPGGGLRVLLSTVR